MWAVFISIKVSLTPVAIAFTDSENAPAAVFVFSSVLFATPDTVFSSDTTPVANSFISLLKRLVNVASSLEMFLTALSVAVAEVIRCSTTSVNFLICFSIEDSAKRTCPPTTLAVLVNVFIWLVSCFLDALLNWSIFIKYASNCLLLSFITSS